jgi:hypothetical protein
MVGSIDKCPYGLDCAPDEACDNCRGLVICPRCGRKRLIPRHRRICFDCSQERKARGKPRPGSKEAKP